MPFTKTKAVIGGAILYELYKKYTNRRDQYKTALKQAKKNCKEQTSGPDRERCMHKAMASFYRNMAKLELDQVRHLQSAAASPTRIQIHQKRAQYYKELARMMANPNMPISKARETVQDRMGPMA